MTRILFLGKLADIAGARARDFQLPSDVRTLAQLVGFLSREERTLGAALSEKSIRIVLNEKIVMSDAAITDDDEIAFLPPVSGG